MSLFFKFTFFLVLLNIGLKIHSSDVCIWIYVNFLCFLLYRQFQYINNVCLKMNNSYLQYIHFSKYKLFPIINDLFSLYSCFILKLAQIVPKKKKSAQCVEKAVGTNLRPSISVWFCSNWASLVPQLVKNSPIMWETWVQSLGWEDPLEKRKATHSSILAWRIPWTV